MAGNRNADMEYRAVRYRLHPGSRARARLLHGTAGASRAVWNHFVGVLRDEYEFYGKCDFRFYSLAPRFTNLRKAWPWLNDYSANNVRDALKPIETAYRNFFKDPKVCGLPKFKSKHGATPSFALADKGCFKATGEWLHIQKIGTMRIAGHNPYPDAEPVRGQVKFECGRWYAYLVYKVRDADLTAADAEGAVGIDRNCGQVTLSDGTRFDAPDTEADARVIARLQRKLARQQKGSRRRNITKAKIRRAWERVRHRRQDWAHQVSRAIADNFSVAFLEDLNIRGMTGSAAGTVENPGRRAAQKRGLNRAILKSAWGALERMLAYKMLTEKVPAPYTSQTCSRCGHTAAANRRTQAAFHCVKCGHRANADVNAAINIRLLGMESLGVEPRVAAAWKLPECRELGLAKLPL